MRSSFIHTLQDTAREAIPFCAPAVYSLFGSQISHVCELTLLPPIGVNCGIRCLQQPSTKSICETLWADAFPGYLP